jgi:pyruvate,orthophosphate dikinase
MFREGERLEIVRGAILVAAAATRAKAKAAAGDALSDDEREVVAEFDTAMGELEKLQQGDFEGIFTAMDGLPVVIRLIDPPLHEFLPNLEEQLVKVTRAEDAGGASAEDEDLLRAIRSMHEQNPMLGLRGVRLGLMIPDFVKVQTRAILNAEIAVKKAGGHPIAKIMIPLVGHVNELARTRELLEAEATAVRQAAGGVEVDYKFGTMIEVPRGALTADEIAREASFFSFGTNDLTQMTFGYSRDDAEGGFLLKYVEDKILPVNPFQTLDDAVADLMRIAVEKGRGARPDLEVGICGEHGGDPDSIAKCERIGLDYVSCSPFRVPVARLAAAQATLTARDALAERDK